MVIIGENHTFDNVYGTHQAPRGQHVTNLLSEGIVTASGNPGTNVGKAVQNVASDTSSYQLNPQRTGAYATLPQPTISATQRCAISTSRVLTLRCGLARRRRARPI